MKNNLFGDLHGTIKVKELVKEVIHGFRFYKGYNSKGEQQVMTMCKRLVPVSKASPDKEKITCDCCIKKFTTFKKIKR